MIKSIFFVGRNQPQFTEANQEIHLVSESTELGYAVLGSLTQSTENLISIDWQPLDHQAITWLKRSNRLSTLVIYEPEVIIPEHASRKVRRMFNRVIEVGRPFTNPIVPWPQTWTSPSESDDNKSSDRAVLIQSAKYSFVKGQLYGLRIRLASTDERIDVYGHGWTEPSWRTLARLAVELVRAIKGGAKLDLSTFKTAFGRPLSYLGPVESKTSAMAKFKVAVVIENSQEYMSEKLFDAFFARCIPVYVGAELEPFGIPDSLYVKAAPTQESVSEAISFAVSMDYESWRSKVDAFLDDPLTRNKWEGKSANRRILKLALGLEADSP